MAWFRNYYRCARCHETWTDEWSCTCEDDCPHCNARHMTPLTSEDLTDIIVPDGPEYIVCRSPETAEHSADYRELARLSSWTEAEAFLIEHPSDTQSHARPIDLA